MPLVFPVHAREVTPMSKLRNNQRAAKKPALKTMAEKKQAKRDKKNKTPSFGTG